MPKWIETLDEGYQIGTAKIPDLLYVDDNALVTAFVEAMQRILDMVGAWSTWTGVEFRSRVHGFRGTRTIHPDIDLSINGAQLQKADLCETTLHFEIPVRMDQLCDSGGRSNRLDENNRFLPNILNQIREKAESIVNIENISPTNAIELLDSMAKAKALYACKVVAVPTSFLTDLDTIIINAARKTLKIPRKHCSRGQVHAPTFIKGL